MPLPSADVPQIAFQGPLRRLRIHRVTTDAPSGLSPPLASPFASRDAMDPEVPSASPYRLPTVAATLNEIAVFRVAAQIGRT
jgi:hypothetical protein